MYIYACMYVTYRCRLHFVCMYAYCVYAAFCVYVCVLCVCRILWLHFGCILWLNFVCMYAYCVCVCVCMCMYAYFVNMDILLRACIQTHAHIRIQTHIHQKRGKRMHTYA